MLKDKYSTWVEVDLNAIKQNITNLKQKTGVATMAIVKANAYGHGAIQVSAAALEAGASWLGVARVSEGVQLRDAGFTCPILLLGYTPPRQYQVAIERKLAITIWDKSQVTMAAKAAGRSGKTAKLHIKVDTGMNRLGVHPTDLIPLAKSVLKQPELVIEGMFTHFARADEIDQTTTNRQIEIFKKTVASLRKTGIVPEIIHSSNSAASLTRPKDHYDIVRLGIAMYGLSPSKECPLPPSFRPALTWKAVLSHVKTVPAGQGISYGHEYITSSEERIGTIPVGYADGFRRTANNSVIVHGKRVPVRGRVCMDQIMVSLDRIPEAKAGDEVVLLGTQGKEHISADELASRWGTINYEVVCGIGARVPRIYVEK